MSIIGNNSCNCQCHKGIGHCGVFPCCERAGEVDVPINRPTKKGMTVFFHMGDSNSCLIEKKLEEKGIPFITTHSHDATEPTLILFNGNEYKGDQILNSLDLIKVS